MESCPIYRIIHIDNLGLLYRCGGLASPRNTAKHIDGFIEIGNKQIINVRRDKIITTPFLGEVFLGDFVPFNFCPRSVMLHKIQKNYDISSRVAPDLIVHLVSSLEAINQCHWIYADQNARRNNLVRFYDGIGIHKPLGLKWNYIETSDWRDPEVRSYKQAECLVKDWVPISAITEVVVYNVAAKQKAEQYLKGSTIPVSVKSSFYY